ncbi:MAG: IS3 family transposase [Eubacteriaceae bacterium]
MRKRFSRILNREIYYCSGLISRDGLTENISEYIRYYNNVRIQRKLRLMSPVEFHESFRLAA